MTDQAITVLLAIIGFLITIFLVFAGFIFKVWFTSRGTRTDDEKQMSIETKDAIKEIGLRLTEIDRQILTLDFPVKLLWAKAEQKLSKELHMPHEKYKEMDALLTQLDDKTITVAGRKRLKVLAEERITDFSKEITEEHRESAAALGPVMDKSAMETVTEGETTNLEVVGEKEIQEP